MNMSVLTFDQFTQRAGAALVFAQQEALRLGYPAIEAEHLLLGLLSLSDGMVVRILSALGIEREDLRGAVMAILEVGAPGAGEIHLSSRAKKVLEFAAGEMIRLGNDYIGTEHLLLGLLREEEGRRVTGLLHRQGVRLEAVRAEVALIYAQTATNKSLSGAPHSSPMFLPEGSAQVDATSAQEAPVLLDSARQQQAMQLARRRQRGALLYFFTLFAICMLIIVFTSLSPVSSGWLGNVAFLDLALVNVPVLNWQPVSGWFPLLILPDFSAIMLSFALISLPFVWYINFFVPRRYGLFKGTVWNWLALIRNAWLFSFLRICLLVEVAALLIAVQPQTWWVWLALLQFLFTLLMSRFASVLSFARRNTIEPLVDTELNRLLQALLVSLRIPTCRIYVLKISHRSSGANAYASGWGKGRRIILTDTLVQHLSLDEVEAILAHELGHLVHHDVGKRLLLRALPFLGLYYTLYLELNPSGDANLVMLNLLSVLGVLIAVVIYRIFMHRYYRYQEYQADQFALQATGKIQIFKNAMTRLTDANLLVARSSRGARHPTSHPTLVERLQHADDFAARNTPLSSSSL